MHGGECTRQGYLMIYVDIYLEITQESKSFVPESGGLNCVL